MQSILFGTLNIVIYFVIAAAIVTISKLLLPIPSEVTRKSLHFVLLGSFIIFMLSFKTWQATSMAAIVFEVLVYPVLAFLEKYPKFSELTTERKQGELKNSLMLVFTMFAIVVAICWGGFGDKFLALGIPIKQLTIFFKRI